MTIDSEIIGLFLFTIFFLAFVFSGFARFWNSPDDPRGQQLTLEQILSIFKKDKN